MSLFCHNCGKQAPDRAKFCMACGQKLAVTKELPKTADQKIKNNRLNGGLVYKMEGVGELLEVYEEKVSITPQGILGFMSKGLKGTKTILYASISAIQFKKAGLLSGYIQFTIPGGNESKGGVYDAASDENSFMFYSDNNELALAIKNFIENKIVELRTGKASPSMTSLSDELLKLMKLKEQGVLTNEEFQAAKKRLIG